MNWPTGVSSWLEALKARRDNRAGHTDRADMGTAFGLDASLLAAEEPSGHEPAVASDAAPPPWAHRIIRRSGL